MISQNNVIETDEIEDNATDTNEARAFLNNINKKVRGAERAKLKVAIANVHHDDLKGWWKTLKKNYIEPLNKRLEAFEEKEGIVSSYIPMPTLEFFSTDMYEYDVILLCTHGGYWDNVHNILTGQCLGVSFHDDDPYNSNSNEVIQAQQNYENIFTDPKYRRDDMTLYWALEKRKNKWGITKDCRVAYPIIYESFFDNDSFGNFENPKSILFNSACHTLEGSDSFAEILFEKRNLGTYFGYTQSNCYGGRAGTTLLESMLNNCSADKAYENLKNYNVDGNDDEGNRTIGTYQEEVNYNSNREYLFTAKLEMKKNNESDYNFSELFLFPTITIEIDQEKAMDQFKNANYVEIEGYATILDFEKQDKVKALSCGFEYGGKDSRSWTRIPSTDKMSLSKTIDKGNIRFKVKLKNLGLNQTYYYRAYTFDGQNYNYGDKKSFTLYKDLELSQYSLSLELGSVGNVKISGSGYFEAISSDPETVTVSINNLSEGQANLIIEPLKAGPATITVIDTKTNQTKTIKITVTPKYTDLQLSTTKLSLVEGSSGSVSITAGSGEYGVTNLNSNIAKATLNGTTITIQALAVGDAKVVVTDVKSGQIKIIEVTVTKKVADLQLSTTKLSLVEGNSGTVSITAGSGEYGVTNLNSDIAKATLSGTTITIQALAVGDAKVVVTDVKTGQKKIIEVTVTKKAADLQLSTTKLSLVEGNSGTVSITAGSGEYGVTNLNSDIAKATLNGTTITIQALAVGDAKVVVTDVKTGQKKIIEVTVTKKTGTSDIALSTQEVYLNVGETKQIEVTAGSGHYSVWIYAPEVANVTVNGNIITIKGLSSGKTIVKVTDTTTNKTIPFGIEVKGPSANEKDAVDLGLSVKWAKMNVGAVSEEDCGEHYAWGETESKSYFSWSSYDFCNGTESTISKYNNVDGKTMLDPSNDAAHVIMGGNWRTPTLTEMEELVNRCKWTVETLNGVKGARVTGPNGNSIFLPFGGQMFEDQLSHYDNSGYYYASTLSSNGEKYAPALCCFGSGNKQEFVHYARYYGLSIRGVLSK